MSGQPPFGYRYEEGQLVQDAAEQETINTIRELRKSKSYGVVAAELNRANHLNRGKYWNPSTLWYIVNRPEDFPRRKG